MMDISTNRDYRPLLKEALLEIEELQSELKAVQHTQTEPLAIIGMGCRFPGGGNNPEAFWQLLKNGSNLCVDIPASRWDIDAFYDPDPAAPGKVYTRTGHFLNVPIDRFDPQFFGLSPREAKSLDPQQRLLLEVCWESLEHAGLDATGLLASKTGVFVGLMNVEYPRLAFPSYEAIDMHSASGNAPSTAAGRIAYTFGFQGPTLAIDTACSSSLVAVHMACQSLRLGECDMALACGTNLMLGPEMYIGECRSQMLSTDGLCKTFDIAADGFGRGEGCGVVVLKRLSDAQRDRDTILALIRGSAVNQDGRSGGLTVPNGLAQEQVIGAALNNGQVERHQLQYVEAHGTGTSLGDPIEITALGNVFGQSHSQEQPLMVGSVKTNIGHTEATAGIAGLIKLVLQLQHDAIAPHLNLSTPNPYIDWEKAPVTIPTTLTPWPRSQTPRLAGVSSFGFSGTNAHVIVEEAPVAVPTQPDTRPWQILMLSAKEQTALQQLAKQYESYLETMPADDLADVCFSTRVGRAHFEKRLALVGRNKDDLLAELRAWQAEKQVRARTGHTGKIAVLFTGQGAQYVGMGRQLYETQPLFRQTLDHCNTILQAYLDLDILNILYPDTSETGQAQNQPLQSASPSPPLPLPPSPLDQTTYTQPALFVIEYALYKLWQSWGITPSVVMGHSIGEIVAACVADVFSLEDGLKLSAMRGKLMGQLSSGGAMLSVMASVEQVKTFITERGNVTIAAINGPESTVISGEQSAVQAVAQQLAAQEIKTKQLQVSHAFHSPLMKPMLAEFEQVVQQISYSLPQLKLISNVTGQIVTEEVTTPEYWCNHILAPVNFAAGMDRLQQEGINIFLECGPQPILLGMGRQCLPEKQENAWLPSLRAGQDDWQQMLSSLGELYTRGVAIDWTGFDADYPQRRKVSLPTYPFQRQRYWVDAPPQQPMLPAHALVGNKLELASTGQTVYHQIINLAQYPWIDHHRVYDTAVMPGVSYIAMTLATLKLPATVDAVSFLEPLFLATPSSERETELIIEPVAEEDTCQAEVFSRDVAHQDEWRHHASLTVQHTPQPLVSLSINITSLKEQLDPIAADTLNELYGRFSVTYGPMLSAVQRAWGGDGVALSEIVVPEALIAQLSDEPIHPVLLDACIRLNPDLFAFDDEPGVFWAPWQVERVTLMRPAPRHFYAYVRQSTGINEQLRTYDIHLLDEAGQAFGYIDGFTLKRAPRQRFLKYLQADTHQWLYQLQWQESVVSPTTTLPAPDTWLLLVPTSAWAEPLRDMLAQQQQSCVVVSIGKTFQQLDEYHYQVCPTQENTFEQLFQQLQANNITLKGIVHLWSLTSDLETLTASLKITCGSTLQLLQSLLSQSLSPALWLVTQGSQHLGREQEAHIEQTPLWGLGRVIALEHPEVDCHLLDLDAASPLAEAVSIVVQELLNSDTENLIAYHQTQRHVARLHPYSTNADALPPSNEALVQADASYLITGGLGAIGLQVAQWLGQLGATSLVLMGRHTPSESAASIINALRQAGVHVSVVQADVADATEVATVLDEIDTQLPPLKGIIHAAGVIADGLLQNQSWSQFELVMAAKVLGSWHLHQLTQDKPLDFFVCFSSAASLIGSSGQGNYAAANAFMDGLAHYRRGQGLPGLSINWGPWAGDGMTAQLSHQYLRRFEQAGFQPLDVEVGLSVLQQCLQLGMPQVGVLPINWSKWSAQATATPLLKAVLPENVQPSQAGGWLLQQLETTPMVQRRVVLMDQVRLQVAQVLGISDSTLLDVHTGLFDLGIDSLMVTELRNRLQSCLGCRLSATDLFNYNTLDDLVNYLIHEVFQWDEITLENPIQTTEEALRIGIAEIETMELDQLNACISEELEELETL